MFPPSVLANVYVKGSLKNTENGFEFDMKNMVDSGTLVEIGPINVDGKAYESAAITLITGNQERPGDQITYQSPFPVYFGSAFTIRITGDKLAAGEHTIDITVLTREIGRLRFDVQDVTS